MNNEKEKNLTRFLLTFFLGWIGSIIINHSNFKPKGFKSRTLAYFFLTSLTFGIYGLVAAIANLSFDPNKNSIIGYYRDEDYVYDENGDDYQIDSSLKSKKELTLNVLCKNLVACVSAIFAFFMLFFNIIKSNWAQNGFSFIIFKNYFIKEVSYMWAIYLIGVLCIIFLLISLAQIGFSIFNIIKKSSFGLRISLVSVVTSLLYMIIGIIFVSICKATYGGDYFFATSAFIPFIIQVVLLVGYIVVGKFVPNKVLAQNNANNFQQATNQNSQKPKPVTKSNLEMLEKLASLKASGAITEEEFNEKKKELLGL